MNQKMMITLMLGIFSLILLATTIFCAGADSSALNHVSWMSGGGFIFSAFVFFAACEQMFKDIDD